MKIVGVSGSMIGSKTVKVVSEVLEAVKRKSPAVETELIDLKEYEIDWVRGLPLEEYNDDTQKVVQKMIAADALVFGTPIYQASISGVLKNLFDHLPMGVFQSKVTGIVTTAGSERHFLVAEYQLKPILQFLKATVPNTQVFAVNGSFNEKNEIVDQEVLTRIDVLAEAIVQQ
ncbi:NADPH-dependent FMN reductase [Halalkalibacter sp. APA_J-10(15)]|uniref:NADPH-dependent FMN reductase n=1 Tax=Halalkalibacter sp. APA_J-10(15) TaxID=2933805 RepID=UPI001FF376E5|nr:NAD(P)H-dependent oxidoreductase [Halalkalibacter sp. APA_J-10(15)]MCK0470930.1 NAD(P)H-dependent oxidoreductase [Halalkalibacter sp. APA_J-10(15)]